MCVAVVLGTRSVNSESSRNSGAHHLSAKYPSWRKLSLIILIILMSSCTAQVRTRSWESTACLLTRAECDRYPHHYWHDRDKYDIVEEEFRCSPARHGFCSLGLVRKRNIDREFHNPTRPLPIGKALNFEWGQLTFIRGHLQDSVVGHSSQFPFRNSEELGQLPNWAGGSHHMIDAINMGVSPPGSISFIRFPLPSLPPSLKFRITKHSL